MVRLKGALPCLSQFLATKSPFKMMENAFYFTLKALFIRKMFKFLPRPFWSCSKTMCLFGHGFIRNLRLISKFMASSTGKQITTVHILPKISRSKCNQTMKFGMLVEYNMRNIFLEKSYRTYSGEYSSRPFLKN